MTNLTRRQVLAGTTAAAATSLVMPLFEGAARASAPATARQAPSFYRTKLGDFEVTQIADGAATFPMPDTFVRNVPKEQALAAAEAAYMPKGMVTVPFNPVVVNTGSKLVLFDAGYGQAIKTAGLLPAHMAAAGIDPKSIDIVVLTHLHPDHVNGIRNAEGGLTYPNAEIKVPDQDWAFWMSDDNMNRAQTDMMKNYFANNRRVFAGLTDKVTRYEWGKEVAPGITAFETSGHTPGHTSFTVQSGSAKMLIQADVTNIPEFFLRHPDWHVAYDVDPEKAVQTRRRFYDMASAEKTLISGFHFSFPSMGYVEKDGNDYRLVPIRWAPVL